MLKGKRVLLRPVKRSDAMLFFKWFNDTEVTKYLNLHLPLSEVEVEKWIEETIIARKQMDIFFVIEISEGRKTKAIGTCGIHKINAKDRNAEIDIIIGEKKQWGKGYGREATGVLIKYCFQEINLRRIATGAYSFNKRSIRALLSVGFRKEGRQLQIVFKNGKYHDNILFGLLKKEWETRTAD